MSQNHNILNAAEDLIQEHFELEPALEQVIWVNPDKTTEIRLLEITPETFPAGEVLSYYFPACRSLIFIGQTTSPNSA